MKVVLLENVPALGRKFDIVQVKDGYALNFLFPKKLAKVATPEAEKEVATRKKHMLIQMEELKAREQEMTAKIKELGVLEFHRKTSAKGHLFAAVTEKDILQALREKLNAELGTNHVLMGGHIKELGTHTIQIKIGDRPVPLTLHILAEDTGG